MKNSMNSSTAIMVCLMTVTVLLTNNLNAQAPSKKPFAEQAMNKISKGFRFDIKAIPCFAGGTSLYVAIEKSNNYAFLWEIDGKHGGHQMNQECISGEYAKLRVMRLSDGKQLTKTIRLSGS